MENTVICCLIWDVDASPWRLRIYTNAIVSHAPPERLTYEDERPTFGVARQALYDLLYDGFANEVEVSSRRLVFTGLAPFSHVDIKLTKALQVVFGRPVTLTWPITEPQTVTVE